MSPGERDEYDSASALSYLFNTKSISKLPIIKDSISFSSSCDGCGGDDCGGDDCGGCGDSKSNDCGGCESKSKSILYILYIINMMTKN